MSKIIFQPEGRQMEYCESKPGAKDGYICNLYNGCVMGCVVCKPHGIDTVAKVAPKDGFLERLDAEARAMECGNNPILLSFMCDPYQDLPDGHDITRQALEIFAKYGLNINIMTKGGSRVIRDMDIIMQNKWTVGTSLAFVNDRTRRQWEPCATHVKSRTRWIELAWKQGIPQWVSLEPVVNFSEAIELMCIYKGIVSDWIIGKRHGNIGGMSGRKWVAFCEMAMEVLKGNNYLIRPYIINEKGEKREVLHYHRGA